ncbi:hypothetical protein X560_1595 [Listeria fleischmannii 1991]|uniref:Predicted methyltransferase (Contains TPR repeat) n=2 Tax=Listeria fleischmannii TaxID=1069827 RepID=A0A2X3GJW7_9LIST|nr:hypothetical protein [Listeria fleischmannii]EMG27752.1 hypothetical protein LFLEISCH_09482 [Listeria fleischmannii subsp. fleischmannii LU2006-1]KMT59882.1 hypothetical protein X560_1595 [Listeria fleischmannii 1991]SQC62466.1 Predicted methyltransferase (contains TPR repeat) [Listeria fleischmannii subsp. fleischmannii]
MTGKRFRDPKVIHFLPNGQFYFERGIVAFREEKMTEAIGYLERARELEPFEPVIICQLAICYTEIGQFHKSNQLLRYILEKLDANMHYCYYFIANNFAYLKDFKRALQYAKRYVAEDPKGEYVEEANDLMDVLLEESPIGQSLENKFIKVEQEFYEYKKEINRYLAEEDSVSACRVLERVIDEKPNFWPAYNQLAALYFEQLREEEGLRVLYDLLERSSGNLLGRIDLFMYHYFKSNEEEAKALYSELSKIVPILTHHRERLGYVHAMMGAYKTADDFLGDIVDLEVTERPKFYYYRAKTAYYLGNIEFANEMWEQFLNCDVYEKEDFPFTDKADDFVAHVPNVLRFLASKEPALHYLGVYALSISPSRAEMVLFHPLFEMTNWTYEEHLVFTQFVFLADGIPEQNSRYMVELFSELTQIGLPLSEENLAFYVQVVRTIWQITEKRVSLVDYEKEAVISSFVARFGSKSQIKTANLDKKIQDIDLFD